MKLWECKKKIHIQSKQYFAALKGFKRGNEIQDVGLINSMYCLLHEGKRALCLGFYCP